MIYFPLLGQMGRLGNQLFQVAATFADAERTGNEAILPVWEYGRYFAGPWKYTAIPAGVPIFKEPSYNYSPIEIRLSSFALEGYFQSYKYFYDQEAAVRKALSWPLNNREGNCFPSNELEDKKLPLVTEPGYTHIAIHVRRGDFLEYPTKFPALPADYYDRSIRESVRTISIKSRKYRLHIFSDDMEWCRENFISWGNNRLEIVCHEGNTDIEDLYLMTHCQHFIIANSSFSWWGAWLGKYPGKTVITPHHRNWFGPENGFFGQTQDLLPPTWKQIAF